MGNLWTPIQSPDDPGNPREDTTWLKAMQGSGEEHETDEGKIRKKKSCLTD